MFSLNDIQQLGSNVALPQKAFHRFQQIVDQPLAVKFMKQEIL